VIRLASGRLFFVADYNPKHEKHIHKDGAFVALSEDDGANWTMKRLPADILTVGYTTATQGADGVLHVVTSKNSPNYEIELNEAWVLDKNAADASPQPKVGLTGIDKNVDKDKAGNITAVWTTARVSDERILLHGPEAFMYPSGKLMYSATFRAGQKIGEEKYLRENGSPIWIKHYADDGTWTWDNYDVSGKRIAESRWRGKTLLSSDVPDPPARKKSADEKPLAPDSE
jgi:hypothetical protein